MQYQKLLGRNVRVQAQDGTVLTGRMVSQDEQLGTLTILFDGPSKRQYTCTMPADDVKDLEVLPN